LIVGYSMSFQRLFDIVKTRNEPKNGDFLRTSYIMYWQRENLFFFHFAVEVQHLLDWDACQSKKTTLLNQEEYERTPLGEKKDLWYIYCRHLLFVNCLVSIDRFLAENSIVDNHDVRGISVYRALQKYHQ
jgi:hypothetical protein